MRVLIISQPKAGTYLCGALLSSLGLHHTYMHIALNAYDHYDPTQLDQGRKNPNQFRKSKPLEHSLKMVRTGSFAMSHLPCEPRVINATTEFKKIILTRDYDSANQSWKTWIQESGRVKGRLSELNPRKHQEMLQWLELPGVFHLDFQDMININETRINQLQQYIFGTIKRPSKIAMEGALARQTLTKSSRRQGT